MQLKKMISECRIVLNWLAIFAVLAICISGSPVGSKTPASIESIFIGRCLEYQEVVRPELFQNDAKNCTLLWRDFVAAFANRGPCNVQPERYDSFIKSSSHKVDTKNRVMYWSGDVYPFVIDYSSYTKRYTTIRDQLAVYVLGSIEHWCGQDGNPGISREVCPEWGLKDCLDLATTSFWKQMSREFALKVQGMVHVMLNSSSPKPYRREGIFAQSELFRLKREVTPELHVHLVGLLDQPPVESCKSGTTLLQLKEDVEKKGMIFICSEREPSILHFQCVKNPNSDTCKGLRSSSVGSSSAFVPAIVVPTSIFWLVQKLFKC